MHRKYYILYLLLLVCAFTACTPRSLREAQSVVAQADSLWHEGRMYGVDEGDSATLAQAYKTLEAIPLPFREGLGLGSPYAHACYHYGKLLRTKENPSEAMQAFIAATHSRTKDYHILGRVYSNMGDIAHLAGEYQLSYEMYKRSGEMYLKNKDSLLYYYDLNNMAFELAMLKKKDEAFAIINFARNNCSDKYLEYKLLETTAELYLKCAQYDSAIYCVNLIETNSSEILLQLVKAQAFSYLGQSDSALIYANQVLTSPHSTYQNRFNAIYIIENNDSTLNVEDINRLASEREDIRYYDYEPHKEKLTLAMQFLNEDLTRKPDRRWVYTFLSIILFICSFSILYYLWKKRRQHQQIIVELQKKEQAHIQLENDINELHRLQKIQHQQIVVEIENTCSLLSSSPDLKTELHWGDYKQMCSIVNLRLYRLADRLQPFSLSEKEMRLCILVLLQASTAEMVEMIPYAQSGLGKFKYTTARKIGTKTSDMRSFLLNLMRQ